MPDATNDNTEPTWEDSEPPERSTQADSRSPIERVQSFLSDATSFGLYPLVAYSTDGNRIGVLTCSIDILPFGIKILRDVTREGYNLGRRLHPNLCDKLQAENPHVFQARWTEIAELSSQDQQHLGRIVASFGSPYYAQKGFALVDICGFSQLDYSHQLAQLYSLTNALDTAMRRFRAASERLRIPSRFGRSSTGDGFYFWHDYIGGGADVATFYTLVCLLTHCEALRLEGFPMRLRASFVVDGAFMIYGSAARRSPSPVASNAVGAATNIAARLSTASVPQQILIGDFRRQGQGRSEVMTPTTLVRQVNELFRAEDSGAADLTLSPNSPLRVRDKHGDLYYCWNLVGRVPYRDTTIEIGLHPDKSPAIDTIQFQPPTKA